MPSPRINQLIDGKIRALIELNHSYREIVTIYNSKNENHISLRQNSKSYGTLKSHDISTLEKLKDALIKEYKAIPQEMIQKAIKS